MLAGANVPQLRLHHSKGIPLTEPEIFPTDDPETWIAKSRSSNQVYTITYANNPFPRCSCPAGTHGQECGHIVSLLERLKEMTTETEERTTTAMVPSPQKLTVTQRAERAREALQVTRGGMEDAKAVALMQRDMWPDELRNKPAEEGTRTAALIVMQAVELGVSALQAFQYITAIKGKPFLMARMVDALVNSRVPGGYIQIVERTPLKCTGVAVRPGRPKTTITITIQDAAKAGWDRNALYKSNPAAMLAARVKTTLGWMVFADVLAGMDVYDDTSGDVMVIAEVEAVPSSQIHEDAPQAAQDEADEGEYRDLPEDTVETPQAAPDPVGRAQAFVDESFLAETGEMLDAIKSGWGEVKKALELEGGTPKELKAALLAWRETVDDEDPVVLIRDAVLAMRAA